MTKPCKRAHTYFNESTGVRCERCGEFLDGYEIKTADGQVIGTKA